MTGELPTLILVQEVYQQHLGQALASKCDTGVKSEVQSETKQMSKG